MPCGGHTNSAGSDQRPTSTSPTGWARFACPALVLCGWYDELSPKRCSRPLADGIADTEFVVFGNSSHLTILEKEAGLYLAVIRDFLARRLND